MIAEALASLIPMRATFPPGPLSSWWYRAVGEPSTAGIKINTDNAMRLATVFACIRVLAESLASLPLITYERMGERNKRRATDYDLYTTLHDRPNRWQTSFEWREMGMAHLCLRGNFYNRIYSGLRGSATEIIPLNPDWVRPIWQESSGRVAYEYRPPTKPFETILAQDIFHVRGLSLDGVTGVGVLEYARNTIGLAIAQETHGAKLFENGSLPPFALETPNRMTEPAIKNFRRDWRGMHGGAKNAHNPPILEGGMKIHELMLTNEDSQWLESRAFQAVEVARMFRVPPHMVGILDRATFSNIEAQQLSFVIDSLRPWLVRWEQAIARDLIAIDSDYYAEFLVDALLRGDTKSRYEAYSIGIQGGFLLRNEARERENLDPIEGGDVSLEPQNMAPAGSQEPGDGESGSNGKPPAGEGEAGRAERRDRARRRRQQETAEALRPLIADAAHRIASREVGDLLSPSKKAARDPVKWSKWLCDYYGDHRIYMIKTLTPFKSFGPSTLDWEKIVDEHCLTALNALGGAKDVSALLDSWRATLADSLSLTLQEALFDGQV